MLALIKNKISHPLNFAVLSFSLLAITPSAFAATTTTAAPQTAIYSQMAIHHPVWAKSGMVASQEAIATNIGLDILKQGGNAIDAAVAVGYALAVTLPRAGNLGGGGFMLVYLADKEQVVAIDYREKAPADASRDMYLDENGDVIPNLSTFHGLAIGTPGTVMGLEHARKTFGTMSREQLIAPSIKLAKEGIVVTADLATSLNALKERLSKWPTTREIFFKEDGSNYQPGDILKQEDLAKTLSIISKEGEKGFYEGDIAKAIASSIQEANGVVTEKDLKNYNVVDREAIKGTYRGYEVFSMPPPSSGGVHIVQILNMLENYDLAAMGHNSAQHIHTMVESMRRAYADRSLHLGDSDFVKVPVKTLTSKKYAKQLVETIDPNKATSSKDIQPDANLPYESDQTTHFSVVDKWGNAASNTYTLNYSYGSGIVAKGTGVLLNNEMDDFSSKPGHANGYGLIGGEANAIAPGKRPLSSMSPTVILKDNALFMVTGTPGGSRIITTTLQVISNVIDYDMNIAEASSATRIHHQWLPDYIRIESGLSADTIKILEEKGHELKVQSAMGSTQSIMKSETGLYGASDPRRPSALSVGY
ncbi:gamma-glutamyltransferase [uncultured Psychromonas sp.]|uniref:gamma-glutamyltransferase n=1 Tax=uncultured Psychromonas sp. TaxID=173974 RepID=UPI0026038292|nr:gamma-glutamyltransferase [uncultured Psychromonas sp.]